MENILYSLGWGIVAVCSIPLNLLCFVVLKRAKHIEDVTKVFLYSLTTTDLIYCLFRVVPAISISATGRVLLGDYFCTIQSFFSHTAVYVLFPTLLAVNVERYICITYPLKYWLIVTKRRAIFVMVFIWSYGVVITVLSGFHMNWKANLYLYVSMCYLFNHEEGSYMIQRVMVILEVVIIGVIIILFIKMYITAKRFTRQSSALQTRGTRHNVKKNSKAATTFFLMTSTFLLANVPWIILLTLEKYHVKIPLFVYFLSEILYGLAGIGDMVVYYFRNRSFQQTTKEVLRGYLRCLCRT